MLVGVDDFAAAGHGHEGVVIPEFGRTEYARGKRVGARFLEFAGDACRNGS